MGSLSPVDRVRGPRVSCLSSVKERSYRSIRGCYRDHTIRSKAYVLLCQSDALDDEEDSLEELFELFEPSELLAAPLEPDPPWL